MKYTTVALAAQLITSATAFNLVQREVSASYASLGLPHDLPGATARILPMLGPCDI